MVVSHRLTILESITPRTCLWPLTACLSFAFALSIGLTYSSDHHCYAGTCGEWLFPLQARLHVVVWYLWISISVLILALRTFHPAMRHLLQTRLPLRVPLIRKQLRVGGLLLVLWICSLYGILVGIWWIRLRNYFTNRAPALPGNYIVAAVAQTGHLADVTMGMVLLPVSRHSALSSFFKISPTTTFTFHIIQAYILFTLVVIHGSLYARWATLYNLQRRLFRTVLPVLNPTYLYHEVWPGNTSSLAVWRASLIFTGIVASLIMLVMFFTSFPSIRRRHFNVFYFTHLSGILAVVIICLHASTMFYCTLPGLSMWLLDWGMRFYELRQKLNTRLSPLGNGWYCLTLTLPRSRLSGCACHSPLAHFYIHHSESSLHEIHPFTTITHLASQKAFMKEDGLDSIDIQFVFRQSVSAPAQTAFPDRQVKKSTQWTNKLASLTEDDSAMKQRASDAEKALRHTSEAGVSTISNEGIIDSFHAGVDTILRLEGPYFTPAQPSAYKTAICLVAGTGLSGAIAIAAAFIAENNPNTPLIDCGIGPKPASQSNSKTKTSSRWKRCVVIWSVRERDYTDIPFLTSLRCEGLEFRVHLTGGSHPRLDMSKALKDECGQQGSDCWCYISGPNGFIDAAERSCRDVNGLVTFAARWD